MSREHDEFIMHEGEANTANNEELEVLRRRIEEIEGKEENKSKKKKKQSKEDIVKSKKKRKRTLQISTVIIIAILLMIVVKACNDGGIQTPLDKEKGTTVEQTYTPNINYSDIPVFGDATVNSDVRYMTLWNPKDNTSLLKYYIGFVPEESGDYIESNEDTAEYFYESKYVDPGTAFSVEIYPELNDGVNNIRIKTMICDEKTGELMNGNIQDIVLYRE